MLAVQCGGGAAAAYVAAHRITVLENGDGRVGILTVRARIRELPLRTVRCSARSPAPRVKRRCFQNKGVPEGLEALKAATADMFRPLLLSLSDIRSLNTVYDIEDYQIGMLFGAFAGCVGCYQLWRAAPPIFVDAALGYIIYKLSVVSSELHRLRKSNSLITRLKFGFMLFMVLKDIKNKCVLLDALRSYRDPVGKKKNCTVGFSSGEHQREEELHEESHEAQNKGAHAARFSGRVGPTKWSLGHLLARGFLARHRLAEKVTP